MSAARSTRRATVLVAVALLIMLIIPVASGTLARQVSLEGTPITGTPTAGGLRTETSIELYPAGTPNAQGTPGAILPPTSAFATGFHPTYTVTAGPSDTGHELRLYRVSFPASATQTLDGSTNWGITAEAGAVDLTDDSLPVGMQPRRIEAGMTSSASGHGGGVPGPAPTRTLSHVAGDPALVWMITLVPIGSAELTADGGATVTVAGVVPVPELTAENLVTVSLELTGASPIAQSLVAERSNRSIEPAAGSSPVALVVALGDGISVNAPDGTAVELASSEQLGVPDATGWTVTGPLDDYRDLPVHYVAVMANVVELVPNDAQRTPSMQATPVPIAIPADVVTIASDSAACDVEPRTLEELEELPNLILATPAIYEEIDRIWQGGFDLAGTGEPLDDATHDEVLRSLALVQACGATGDVLTFLALSTDAFAAAFVATFPPEALAELAGTPAAAGTPDSGFRVSTPDPNADTSIQVWGFEQFPDGRVGLFLAGIDSVQYLLFVRGLDGIWLLDGQSQRIGVAPATGAGIG
ncbi:MAG TPA: hypothetical protein VGT61_08795 [Thermomicrobiales bacterium]|jgi:hypothetical protein|nr:hypothetical protein [Thermomicrobiales bacterium]